MYCIHPRCWATDPTSEGSTALYTTTAVYFQARSSVSLLTSCILIYLEVIGKSSVRVGFVHRICALDQSDCCTGVNTPARRNRTFSKPRIEGESQVLPRHASGIHRHCRNGSGASREHQLWPSDRIYSRSACLATRLCGRLANQGLPDRLYLASYTHPPTERTPFPYPAAKQSRSPSKRPVNPAPSPSLRSRPPVYFSVDRSLLYNAFHADFGPLHVGHLYRFAVQLHEVLGDAENEGRALVFWSHADSRSKSPRLECEEVPYSYARRSSKRCVRISMLYGPYSILATSPGTRADRSNGPTPYAFPRRWLQPGGLHSHRPGCCLRSMEGEGGRTLRIERL